MISSVFNVFVVQKNCEFVESEKIFLTYGNNYDVYVYDKL